MKDADSKSIFKFSAIQRIMTAIYKAFDYADEREADVSIRRENLLLRLRLRYAMNDENRYDLHLTKK